MGSFSNGQKSNIVNETTGRNFNFNGNSIASNQNSYEYNPSVSKQNFNNTTMASQDIGNALNTLSTPYNVNDAFNNPFYSSTFSTLRQPIDQQFQKQSGALQNQLSAENQTGSSYDALSNAYLNQNYNTALANADNQAHQNAFNAYNQTYNNALSTLSGAEGYASQYNQNLYAPLQYAISYQQALNPLQLSQASYYNAKQSTGNMIAGLGGAFVGTAAGTAAKVYTGGGGGTGGMLTSGGTENGDTMLA